MSTITAAAALELPFLRKKTKVETESVNNSGTKDDGIFHYIISGLFKHLPSDIKIDSLIFHTGRYGHTHHVMDFDEAPVSSQEAIAQVEAWLSVPATMEYVVNRMEKRDVFGFSAAEYVGRPRGSLLGDCIFLESIHEHPGMPGTGTYILLCGS
jgi:hypothetical protein